MQIFPDISTQGPDARHIAVYLVLLLWAYPCALRILLLKQKRHKPQSFKMSTYVQFLRFSNKNESIFSFSNDCFSTVAHIFTQCQHGKYVKSPVKR